MIKFVYFDIGGVVIIDFSETNKFEELKKEIGVNEKNNDKFDEIWNKYESEICLNREVDSLIPILKSAGFSIPENYSLLDGFVSRFQKNQSIWPILGRAKEKYGVGLITNMYPGMLERIGQRGLMPDIKWDAVVDSSKVGLEKPDERIFKLAEEMAGFSGEEVLFVENSQTHIDAAQKLGWQTFLYDSANPEKSSEELSGII